MRVRMAAPFWGVASSSMWRAASAQMVTPPGSRHLTIEELDAILQTDATKEFDWSEEKAIKAGLLWDGAVQFEWNKAADAELNGQRFPYILCHIGEGLSGYKRKLALAEALNLTENDTDIYYLRTLYNADDYLCVYGQLFASVAAGVTGEEFIVQPLVQTLKFLNNFVDNANQEVGKSNANEQEIYVPTLDVILCPNVAIEENVTADDLAFEVIDSLVQKTIASKLAAAISDTYYLTSEAYGNSTDGSEPSERAQLWNTLLNDYQKAGVCDEAYDMTTWTLTRAADLETGLTYVQIEFNNTGNTDQDQACMLTLALAAASNPDVCSVEMREPVGTSNHYATWLTQSELTNERPFFDVGLNGEGQTVTISDTGIDQNNCYFLDNENPASATYNTNSRKIAQYVPFVDTSDYQYGHGTHVAGTVAGKRDDAAGAADGIAPGAKLAFADIGNSAGSLRLPNDYELLSVGRPYSKIHSASWGSELPFYTTQSRNFDQFMYENDDFLILVAAGNSGAGDAPRTVGSPATGKNVIAVGAHHSTGDSRPRGALGPSYIADFSSRGPTSDGRTKPDILSVGKAVLSAGAVPSEFGECDGKIPGPNSASGGLLSLQGTSMATPVAAGTAAIVRQYFEDGYYPTGERNPSDAIDNPSGALIKAVLINGAQYLSGVDNGASGITSVSPYDNNQNFGRVSLQYSVNLAGKTNVDLQVFDREPILDGDSKDYQVQINTSGGCTFPDLSATLVWVEEGSTPGCLNCVMNDLDLSVSLRGVTYFPNGRNGPDRVNSAERVVVKGVQHGDIATITVNAYNLAKRSQNYALVVTGCFGGTENQLYAEGQCSEFECDNSASNRTRNILLAIFVPLGVILLCCVGGAIIRKKKKRSN